MKTSVTNLIMALGLGTLGMAIAAAGIYVGETDDAPGAALLGLLLMLGLVVLAVRIARRKSPQPTERT
jgi:MYXO-CTERM domain-containing protein